MSENKIEQAIADAMAEIAAVDELLMMEVVGVAQALSQLKEALDKVDECLDKRDFSKASDLGYADVASEFIFLQRTLAGLQSAEHQKEGLISKIVMKANARSYEEVEPFVNAKMDSAKERTNQDKLSNQSSTAAISAGKFSEHELMDSDDLKKLWHED